jgi:hypothetical protein
MLAEAVMLACLLGALGALYIFFTQEKPEPYKRPVQTKAPKTKRKKRKKPQKQKIKQSKYTKPKEKKVAFVKHDLIAQSFFGKIFVVFSLFLFSKKRRTSATFF